MMYASLCQIFCTMYTNWGHSRLTNRYALGIFTIPYDISKETLTNIFTDVLNKKETASMGT